VALVLFLNLPSAFCRAPMSGSFLLKCPHMLFHRLLRCFSFVASPSLLLLRCSFY
jgi:hypothetical protein